MPTWIAAAHRTRGVVRLNGVVHPWSERYRSSHILLVDEGVPLRWMAWDGPPPSLERLRDAFGPIQPSGEPTHADLPSTTLIICTRDRPERLRRCLQSVTNGLDQDVDVIVVDSAPRSTASLDVVEAFTSSGSPIRRVVEPRPGLSRARNTGMQSADAVLVAFVDDDVLVEPGWLTPLRQALVDDTVGVAVGLVPSAEVETRAQMEFERRIPWSSRLAPARLSLASGSRLPAPFPYNAGQIGTGANMAVRRATVIELGGFDTALGAGTWTKGGEDLEMFVRVLRTGWDIAYVPSSIVWHVHEVEMAMLRNKVFCYGAGASAYLASVLTRPGRRDVVEALAPLARFAVRRRREHVRSEREMRLELREAMGLLWGPVAYAAERVRQRSEGGPTGAEGCQSTAVGE